MICNSCYYLSAEDIKHDKERGLTKCPRCDDDL